MAAFTTFKVAEDPRELDSTAMALPDVKPGGRFKSSSLSSSSSNSPPAGEVGEAALAVKSIAESGIAGDVGQGADPQSETVVDASSRGGTKMPFRSQGFLRFNDAPRTEDSSTERRVAENTARLLNILPENGLYARSREGLSRSFRDR
jgi:hypothetical protein